MQGTRGPGPKEPSHEPAISNQNDAAVVLVIGVLLLFPGFGLFVWSQPTKAQFEELTVGQRCGVFEPMEAYTPPPGIQERCETAYFANLLGIITAVVGAVLAVVGLVLRMVGQQRE